MERPTAGRAILAGFVATVGMSVLMYAGPMMGMPKMDLAAMLGSMVSQGMPAPASGAWWMGMLAHFINGTIVFPLIYAYALYPVLPGAPWLKGIVWGLILWFLSQAMVMPMMGLGFFSSNAPAAMMGVIGSLIGHAAYGALLGTIAGTGAVRVSQAPAARR